MIRIVLDTNIIVSALLQPLGPSAQIFLFAIGGTVQLCISGSIYAEYEDVIRRPRFRLHENLITTTLRNIREKSIWFRPTESVQACSDPDDNIFLECAQASRAGYLVTGNAKHFPDCWLTTQVVTPRIFLEGLSVS